MSLIPLLTMAGKTDSTIAQHNTPGHGREAGHCRGAAQREAGPGVHASWTSAACIVSRGGGVRFGKRVQGRDTKMHARSWGSHICQGEPWMCAIPSAGTCPYVHPCTGATWTPCAEGGRHGCKGLPPPAWHGSSLQTYLHDTLYCKHCGAVAVHWVFRTRRAGVVWFHSQHA